MTQSRVSERDRGKCWRGGGGLGKKESERGKDKMEETDRRRELLCRWTERGVVWATIYNLLKQPSCSLLLCSYVYTVVYLG